MPIRVLFVCLGNICRSPMAEAVFQHLVNEAGLSEAIVVDSAGTAGWHAGEKAHRGTRAVLAEHNIPYDGRSRQVTLRDFEQFHYILAMDRSNLDDLRRMAPQNTSAKIFLFMDYAENPSTHEVPDPYYDGRFEEVYGLVRQAAVGLLAHIRATEGL